MSIKTVAVLLTCFNRKEKTLASLVRLFEAKEAYNSNLNLSIFLTDDGSTDGTGDAVSTSSSRRDGASG